MARETSKVLQETQVVTKVTCDLCGREAKNQDWGEFECDVDETTVRCKVAMREGVSHPGYSETTSYDVDLCPDCFRGRLVPWLNSQGANIVPVKHLM